MRENQRTAAEKFGAPNQPSPAVGFRRSVEALKRKAERLKPDIEAMERAIVAQEKRGFNVKPERSELNKLKERIKLIEEM